MELNAHDLFTLRNPVELASSSLNGNSYLKGYFRFSSGALTTDSSGNSHTLSSSGSPTEDSSGRFAGAVALASASSQYLYHSAHADFKPTGNWSLGAWVKSSTAAWQTILSNYDIVTAVHSGWRCYITDDGRAYIIVAKGTGATADVDYKELYSKTLVNDGAWHFVSFTWDGSTLRCYVDGNLDNSVSWANACAYVTNSVFAIGNYRSYSDSGNHNFFNGSIDDAFVFNGLALSATQIRELYGSGLRAYYKMESGALTTDSSGNGKTLTNVNTVGESSSGKFGYCADLGATNSDKRFTGADMLNISSKKPRSFSCWVKMRTEIAANRQYFVSHSIYGADWNQCVLGYDYNGGTRRVRFLVNCNSLADLYYNIALGTSNWHHLVLTFDGNNVVGYVDGNSAGSATATIGSTTAGSNQFCIGSLDGGSSFASAYIDDVAIFDKVLSSTEVSELYNIKAWTKSVEDIGTLTEVFQKSPTKIWEDLGTLSEVIVKSATRFLNDIPTLSEVFGSTKSMFFTKTETANLSETVNRDIAKYPTETATLSEVFTTQWGKFLSFLEEFLGFTEDFDTTRGKGLEYTDTVTPTDSHEKSTTRILSETGTLTEVFSTLKNMFSTFIDSFTGFIEDLVIGQSKSRNLSDDISTTDSALRGITRDQIDNATLSESFDKTRATSKSLIDTSTLTDTFTRAFTRIFTDTASLVERIKKYLNNSIIIEYLYKLKSTVFSDKYSSKSTTYSDKYPPKDTQF